MNDVQLTFKISSILLAYPDQDLTGAFPLIKEELDKLSHNEIKSNLQHFLAGAGDLVFEEFVDTYVNTFDFGRKTNLYITYMTSGEQRERGADLLYLKNYYKLNGFLATEEELPDYLPLMLEFAAEVDDETRQPIFSKYYDNIVEIYNRLNDSDNLYKYVFRAILAGLSESGIEKATRRSEELCLNNSCG